MQKNIIGIKLNILYQISIKQVYLEHILNTGSLPIFFCQVRFINFSTADFICCFNLLPIKQSFFKKVGSRQNRTDRQTDRQTPCKLSAGKYNNNHHQNNN